MVDHNLWQATEKRRLWKSPIGGSSVVYRKKKKNTILDKGKRRKAWYFISLKISKRTTYEMGLSGSTLFTCQAELFQRQFLGD